jgi:ubiquinone/menaquinone biosynthesis C-methylase UbiE
MAFGRTALAVSTYDDIAEWYDTWLGAGSLRDDPYWPTVEELLGEVNGRTICDLACGQGRVARYLADLGAHVVGVDLSAKLLEIARRHEETEPRGIQYIQADAQTLEGIADGSFDGMVCCMALMDIADLQGTLRSVARVVRSGGWFVFSILHPCFNTPTSGESAAPQGWVRTVNGYWSERFWRSEARTGPPGKVGAYHRTLSTYVNALTDVGLKLERLQEPPATPSVAERRPIWTEVPAVLVASCTNLARNRSSATS